MLYWRCLSVAAFMWESFNIYMHILTSSHATIWTLIFLLVVFWFLELSSIPMTEKNLFEALVSKKRLRHTSLA